ncbi:hypothetical protein IscW_ISCW016550, partial [Ixodes scapularis]
VRSFPCLPPPPASLLKTVGGPNNGCRPLLLLSTLPYPLQCDSVMFAALSGAS